MSRYSEQWHENKTFSPTNQIDENLVKQKSRNPFAILAVLAAVGVICIVLIFKIFTINIEMGEFAISVIPAYSVYNSTGKPQIKVIEAVGYHFTDPFRNYNIYQRQYNIKSDVTFRTKDRVEHGPVDVSVRIAINEPERLAYLLNGYDELEHVVKSEVWKAILNHSSTMDHYDNDPTELYVAISNIRVDQLYGYRITQCTIKSKTDVEQNKKGILTKRRR